MSNRFIETIENIGTKPEKPATVIPRGEIQCPYCHANIKPKSKTVEGSTVAIAIILLCFFIIPGIIYIIWDSSRKQCPKCHMIL